MCQRDDKRCSTCLFWIRQQQAHLKNYTSALSHWRNRRTLFQDHANWFQEALHIKCTDTKNHWWYRFSAVSTQFRSQSIYTKKIQTVTNSESKFCFRRVKFCFVMQLFGSPWMSRSIFARNLLRYQHILKQCSFRWNWKLPQKTHANLVENCRFTHRDIAWEHA